MLTVCVPAAVAIATVGVMHPFPVLCLAVQSTAPAMLLTLAGEIKQKLHSWISENEVSAIYRKLRFLNNIFYFKTKVREI